MEIVTASGKQRVVMTRKEWKAIGKKAGWTKKAQAQDSLPPFPEDQTAGEAGQANTGKKTFKRLMEDPSFAQTLNTIKKQRANEKRILAYWEQNGINWKQYPELVELFG